MSPSIGVRLLQLSAMTRAHEKQKEAIMRHSDAEHGLRRGNRVCRHMAVFQKRSFLMLTARPFM